MYEIRKVNGSLYTYVDTNGNVFIKKPGHTHYRMLAQQVNNSGYMRVSILLKDGTRRYFLTHRVVAGEFIVNPSKLETVNHKDGFKTNNSVSNLEWLSREDNKQHAIDNKLHVRNNFSPYSDETMPDYYKMVKGDYNSEPGDMTRLAKKYDMSVSLVSRIVGGYDKYAEKTSAIALTIRSEYKGMRGDIKRLAIKHNISEYKVRRYVGKF